MAARAAGRHGPAATRRWRARIVRRLLVLAIGATGAAAFAGEPADLPAAELLQQVRQFALAGTQSITAANSAITRVEIELGSLNPRLRLAPCQRIQPYLPPRTSLWGASRIGLRCVEGPTHWSVYLPITVHAWGHALVATAALPAGSVLGPADLREAEVDLAADPSAAIRQPQLAAGRTLARALAPGQTLRTSHLKARQWFAAGDTVRLLARGPGFAVAGEGRALTAGIEGRPARVRVESGRVLTGRPVAVRYMELGL